MTLDALLARLAIWQQARHARALRRDWAPRLEALRAIEQAPVIRPARTLTVVPALPRARRLWRRVA